jgi:hypothetical protein
MPVDRITESTETKPGVFTTEFWITLAINVVMVLDLLGTGWMSSLPDRYEAIALAVVNGLYFLSRGLAKQGQAYYPPAAPHADLDESELQSGDLETDVPQPAQVAAVSAPPGGVMAAGTRSSEAPVPEGGVGGKPAVTPAPPRRAPRK